MLIGENFILLNLPKTASAFTRKAIKKAYYNDTNLIDKVSYKLGVKERKLKELFLPNIRVDFRNDKDEHGTYDQIPGKLKNSDREIVSIMRNPFAAYVSRYNFESWKRNAPKEVEELDDEFSHFPNLSFKEYLEYSYKSYLPHMLQNNSLKDGVQLGVLSVQFIQIFCKDHKKVLANIDKNYKDNGLYENYFPDITFLKTENINEGLFYFLQRKGFAERDVQFILDKEKVNVSTKKPYQEYLDEEAIKKITDLEWLLFDLFPEYKPENNLQL